METCTIPEDQWTEFFYQMNHEFVGRTATIQVLHGLYGPQNIAMDLPFGGISFDTKSARSSNVQISAGDEPGQHINHVIDLPLYIRQTTEPNGSIDVQIEPANGPITLIHLQGPVQ
jgi:Family of unknown function (DUF5335)